jgi:hypothetical protein
MENSNRRNFLKHGSLGIAAVGLVAATPSLLADRAGAAEPAVPTGPTEPAELEGPLVVYLRDARAGRFSLLVGEREVSFTDAALAARLTHAAK